MATYLLTWNPKKWSWDNLAELASHVARTGSLDDRWSCGGRKNIDPGDRVFLLRQGPDRPGLIASGWATSGVVEDDHWEDRELRHRRKARYVHVQWDMLRENSVITREELLRPPFEAVNWDTQSSGISVEPETAKQLEQEWGRRTGSRFEPLPDEVSVQEYPEGALRRITVNAYERSAAARAACLAHYGYSCTICGENLAQRYGEVAEGLIHVHHIVPVSRVRTRYVVDPVADLRPICPNCHAVVHRREPPFSIEDVVGMLRGQTAAEGLAKPSPLRRRVRTLARRNV